jgi:BMFP domain-containing protein YqiC
MINSDLKETEMNIATSSRGQRKLARLKRILSELDYVQRRVLENQTGVPFVTPNERQRSRQRVSQLEYMYRN